MKTHKSTEIKNELSQTIARLDELAEMRDRLNTNLETLQQAFVGGKTSLDELQSQQARLTTLDSSIEALHTKQSELHDAFQKASLSESRQILLEKAKTIAIEVEAVSDEYVEMRNRFNNLIGEYAAKMLDKRILFLVKQKEYRTTYGQIENQSPEKSGQIHVELRQIGLTDKARNLATATYESYPPVEFVEVIAIAERLLSNKIERAARKASA